MVATRGHNVCTFTLTGEELQRVRLDARFTHDAVRRGDHVYVASTEAGCVLELAYPGMTPLRNISLYQRHDHINTLAPLSNTTLWAVLHNLGEVGRRNTYLQLWLVCTATAACWR
jgi:hypothetical protein